MNATTSTLAATRHQLPAEREAAGHVVGAARLPHDAGSAAARRRGGR